MSRICLQLMLVMAILTLVGCAEMSAAMKKMDQDRYADTVKAAKDPYMLEQFYNSQEFPGMKKQYGAWFISLKHENFAKVKQYEGGGNKLRNDYLSYDSTSDEIAKFYIKAAKSRGNTVKVYKPQIDKMILDMTNINLVKDRYVNHSDWDNAIIEFGQNNRMLSALVRLQRISPQYVSDIFQDMYSVVVFNEAIRNFENKADNATLDKYFISDL